MPLVCVDPRFLHKVWPTVAPMLQRSLDINPDNESVEQLELLVRQQRQYLLVWVAEDAQVAGAVTVEFIDYPRYRAAHVTHMGGKGIVREHIFKEAQDWMRANGATVAQCWCKDNLVGMYEKMGMTNTHKVMRMSL
jgi:hypothetical protein